MLTRDDSYRYHFHESYLEMALRVEEAGQVVILNPRLPMAMQSLALADAQWLIDKNKYRQDRQFFIDWDKRPADLK